MAAAAAFCASSSPTTEWTLWRLRHGSRLIVAFVRRVDHGTELRIHLDGELLTSSLFREGSESVELAAMASRARLTLERHGWNAEVPTLMSPVNGRDR